MDFAIPLHLSGGYKGLPNYEESLVQLKEGRRTNLVADIVIHDPHGGHVCRSQIRRQQFLLQGEIPETVSKITILNALVSHPRGPICIIDEKAAVLHHQPMVATDLFRLVETCTGLGSLGCGAKIAGFQVVSQNDLQASFCQHLRAAPNTDQSSVVHGDICKLETIIRIHEASKGARALAFGFSCQPFSTLGDMKEGDDDRSSTLSFGLYCGYLLQVGLVVLYLNVPQGPLLQDLSKFDCNILKRSRGLQSLKHCWNWLTSGHLVVVVGGASSTTLHSARFTSTPCQS